MSEDETLYLGITGYLCGLCSRAVECLLCKKGMFLREGGFVVQAGDAVDEFCESGAVCGVCAVCVGTDRVGWGGQAFVGNDGAVFCCPIHACLDVVDLRNGYVVEVYHVAADVARCGLFAEKVAAARYTM